MTAALLAVTLGCGEDPLKPYRPFTLTVVGGDEQMGSAGAPLEVPLTVRVNDGDGAAFDGADVVWTVSSGQGLFRVPVGLGHELVSSYATQTGHSGPGTTAVALVPTVLGTSTVRVHATRPNGVMVDSAELTAHSETLAILLDEERDWDADWPHGPQSITVNLGTRVEWRPEPCCDDHRVRSISVPEGGTPFDHPYSGGDPVFGIVPDAPGEWQWEWERSDGDWWWPTVYSDTATLVVR